MATVIGGVASVSSIHAKETMLGVHRLFRDGTVLQQGVELPIWGQAPEGVRVSISIQGHEVEARAEGGFWKATLPPLAAGGPFLLKISAEDQTLEIRDVAVGEVWLCAGQSNMGFRLSDATGGAEAVARSDDPDLRFFVMPFVAADRPQPLDEGEWVSASPKTSGSFSAVAYHFARELREHRGVPVGILLAQLGGTSIQAWMSRSAIQEQFPWLLQSWETTKQSLAGHFPHLPEPPEVQRHRGSFNQLNELELRHFKGTTRLFNGMIAPMIPYGIRGVVWYQGESDQGQAWNYRRWLPAMIEDWRHHWQRPDLPFLIVMLPGFGRSDQGYTYELRDAQFHACRTVAHTHLCVAVDLGDEREVHPAHKRPIGERLARLARAEIYGESITPTGPLFRRAVFEDGRAILRFDHTSGGLEQRGASLEGFTIAGVDERFHPATARIEDDQVIVESAQVPHPVAVRYAWTNTPRLTLWNRDGLPAAPFRTDEFTLRTHWNAQRR